MQAIMSNKNEKICRFCLKSICGSNFDTIEETTKHMLDVLLLNLDLEISVQPIMCNECSKNLQLSFDFKLRFLNTNITLPFIDSSGNDDKKFISVNGDNMLCQICMKNTEEDCLSALYEFQDEFTENVYMFDVLQKHVKPELDLNIPEQVVICTRCLESLQVLLRFIAKCLEIEEKIRRYVNIELTDDKGQIELKDVQQFTFKMVLKDEAELNHCTAGEPEIKEELIEDITRIQEEISLKDETEDFTEIDEMKCSFERNEGMTIEQDDSESFGDTAQFSSTILNNIHKCNRCPFETKHRSSLERHMWLIHKSDSEIMKYKCTLCQYEAQYKRNLSAHMLEHDLSEVSYKCTLCSFESKFKSSFRRHVAEHREIMNIYKCTECKYESKHKRYLASHMLRHKNSTEVTMYKCSQCSYNTKFKHNLIKHVNIHKTSKVWFACEICAYKTIYRGQGKTHMLIHKEKAA